MEIKRFIFNPIEVNCYLLWDHTKEAVLIDCGALFPAEREQLKEFVAKNGLVIKHYLNTHLHFDHCFANDAFPGKPIYIQKSEIEFAKNPWPFFAVTYEAPSLGFSPNWLKAEDQIVPVDGEFEVAEGITLSPLPGHSPGMQGVLVDTDAGKYLLPGDQVNLYEQLESNPVIPYVIPGIHTSVTDCMESMEKILSLIAEGITVLPSHDDKVAEHKCYPAE